MGQRLKVDVKLTSTWGVQLTRLQSGCMNPSPTAHSKGCRAVTIQWSPLEYFNWTQEFLLRLLIYHGSTLNLGWSPKGWGCKSTVMQRTNFSCDKDNVLGFVYSLFTQQCQQTWLGQLRCSDVSQRPEEVLSIHNITGTHLQRRNKWGTFLVRKPQCCHRHVTFTCHVHMSRGDMSSSSLCAIWYDMSGL